MRILNIDNHYDNRRKLSFGAGDFRILAVSDLHGGLRSLAKFVETIERNSEKVFDNSGSKSTQNLLTISGDWFINQAQAGYLTNPSLNNGDIQGLFFKKFVDKMRKLVSPRAKFDTIFTPGNHDFDGGDNFILKLLDKTPIKMVITNLRNHADFNRPNLVKSAVYEVADSVNPNIKHKTLFLGTSLNNMNYYNNGLINKMKFFENFNCTDAQLPDSAFSETIAAINSEIKTFKSENPDGAVVLLSHVGNKFSELIANNTKGINIILNGHDHVQSVNLVNNVPIVSLGQNSEMFRGIRLHFNDKGKLEKTGIETFFSSETPDVAIQMHEFNIELNKLLQNDMLPLIKINPNQYGIEELAYNKKIRYSNSPYANFLTSALRNGLRKASFDVDLVGIQSSAIRGGIKHGSSNLDLLKTFDGIKVHISELEVAELKGNDIAEIIIENILENLKVPERNTIMQWSDIQVNRTLFDNIKNGKSQKSYIDAIKIRDRDTGEFVPLQSDKKYKVALTNKFINKKDLQAPQKIRDKFVTTGIKVQDAFHDYLKDINYQIEINSEILENRII